MIYELLICDLD